jgi:tRNA pseudouridine38-40 synthase
MSSRAKPLRLVRTLLQRQPMVTAQTSTIARRIGTTGATRRAGEGAVGAEEAGEDEAGGRAVVVPIIAAAMAQGRSAFCPPRPVLSLPPLISRHTRDVPTEDPQPADPTPRGEHALKSDRGEAKRQRRFDPALTTGADGEPKQTNMSIPFSAEEIAAEDRRPKRKVAVLIGYAGTGYKGMQMNHHEKTIEGDLFAAFVAAGAIAKRNADDPKKSSFIRCARTDKGVHAAGNVISLKLTIEDPDIVAKINEKLPEQIRIWGIQRTNNAFNCYQACDSRWYEYLLPSYSLLPPHPQSYLGKKITYAANEKGVSEDHFKAWDDIKDFWEDVERNEIQPILAKLDEKTREEVIRSIHADDHPNVSHEAQPGEEDKDLSSTKRKAEEEEASNVPSKKTKTGEDSTTATPGAAEPDAKQAEGAATDPDQIDIDGNPTDATTENADSTPTAKPKYQPTPAEIALREIKTAYVAAKRKYRITPARIQQLQAALDQYKGTNNFHNYTIKKPFKDPSAKRHIRSFDVNPSPIQIGDTEWLSLKVHGQSFMMHQIRKMVAMAVLCVRCASPVSIIKESYGPTRISIPKAPGLGLLLERPVFETYSKKAESAFDREPLNFTKFEKEINEFKQKEIYNRIYDTEEKENS